MIDKNFWHAVTKQFNLGKLQTVTPIQGGLLHKIFHVITDQTEFAIKLLDAWMINIDSIQRWELTEQFAHHLQAKKIPAIAAIAFQNKFVQQINKQNILIYPWCQGKVFLAEHVEIKQAKKIGEIVAQLHLANDKNLTTTQFKKIEHLGFPAEHWQNLIAQLQDKQLADLLAEHLALIINLSELAKKSITLQEHAVISHRDLQPRNVIWMDEISPAIIDWEYAGWINAGVDLLITAFDWSYVTSGKISLENCNAVFAGYAAIKNLPLINEATLYGYYGYCLDWLEFSIRRGIAEPEQAEFVKQEIVGVTQALKVVTTSVNKDFFNELNCFK